MVWIHLNLSSYRLPEASAQMIFVLCCALLSHSVFDAGSISHSRMNELFLLHFPDSSSIKVWKLGLWPRCHTVPPWCCISFFWSAEEKNYYLQDRWLMTHENGPFVFFMNNNKNKNKILPLKVKQAATARTVRLVQQRWHEWQAKWSWYFI